MEENCWIMERILQFADSKTTGERWIFFSENVRKCVNNAAFSNVHNLFSERANTTFFAVNRKWKNSAKNCRAFNSFVSVASDHRVVSTQIRLSLRANKKKNSNISLYDWTHLKDNPEIRNTFITRVKNRFAALQDTTLTKSTNTRYNLFELACKET